MGYKLPLVVRQNYTVKKVKTTYHLTCLTCNITYQVDKPLTDNDVRPFIDHAQAHKPEEEESLALAVPSIAPPLVPSLPPGMLPSMRPSKLPTLRPTNSSMPPPPNSAYMIMVAPEQEPSISYIPLTAPLQLPSVSKQTNGNYIVILNATNRKHAIVVAMRLIEEYIRKSVSRPSSSHP